MSPEPITEAAAQPSRARRWVGRALLVVGVVAFAIALSTTDLHGALAILGTVGPLLLLGALPYLVQIGLDALAWRTLLVSLDRRVRWRRLLAIRLSTEAVLMSMPAGTFVGESLKPFLLRKTDDVPFSQTIASIGIKKCMLAFAEAVYLGTALVLGSSLLARHSEALIGTGGLPLLVAAAVALLALFAVMTALAFVAGGTGVFVHRLLMRVPIPPLRRWLTARHAPFDATDGAFRRIGAASRWRLLAAFAMLLGAWFSETGETWVLLHLLGIHLPITDVLVMEASVVFLRNLAFFVPAGLGVQDAGYIAFLRVFGIANAGAAAAAFVIVKRAKEVLWVGVGYLTLLALQLRSRPQLPGARPLRTTTESP